MIISHQDEPNDETPELEGDTDPSTKTLAATSTMGDDADVNLSPEIRKIRMVKKTIRVR